MSKSAFHFAIISSNVLPFRRDGGGPAGTLVDPGAGEAPAAGAAVEVEAPADAPAGVVDVALCVGISQWTKQLNSGHLLAGLAGSSGFLAPNVEKMFPGGALADAPAGVVDVALRVGIGQRT